jgi:hypothetical protein
MRWSLWVHVLVPLLGHPPQPCLPSCTTQRHGRPSGTPPVSLTYRSLEELPWLCQPWTCPRGHPSERVLTTFRSAKCITYFIPQIWRPKGEKSASPSSRSDGV